MGLCHNDECTNSADQRCSNCKLVTYCSTACQKKAWKTHKRECEINRILREQEEIEAAEAGKREYPKPRTTRCTGCNVRFTRDYPARDTCPDCGYTACESCVCHDRRGSCSCQNTNFGRPYCIMTPTHYHMSSRSGKAYTGDRHPDYRGNLVVQGPERDTMFEKSARECCNCGETKICMTKKGIQRETQEYLRLWG
ncbi:hypothetical protein C8J57DRAFT_1056248 [Mycena rebaudengoi]|nr:hypothetical protein C8J57DRAFT_1056248 [Mycena rebaudengoi]